MAAESPELEAKRSTTYLELHARSYVTRCASPRMRFRWMINPYRGCEFGCKYCFARYTHEFMELRDPNEFEHRIFAKRFNPYLFEKEIKKLPVGEVVAIGTATDPYQPAERRFLVTRRMLDVLAKTSGLRLGITTKSDLIARDAALLEEVARRHFLRVAMTITALDKDLARLIEPLAPRPDLRLEAIRVLRSSGVRVIVLCAPVMPLINDSEKQLRALAEAAQAAGACGFGVNILFLKPCAREVFLPFLAERFPHLVRKYRERYDKAAYLRGAYPEGIHARVAAIHRDLWPDKEEIGEPELWPQDMQLNLFV